MPSLVQDCCSAILDSALIPLMLSLSIGRNFEMIHWVRAFEQQ